MIVAIIKLFSYHRLAKRQQRIPICKKPAPIHSKTRKARDEVESKTVIPNPERVRKRSAWAKIATMQISPCLRPYAAETITQLIALGPGVVKNSAQKLANMIQAFQTHRLIYTGGAIAQTAKAGSF